jgi:YesN/AraC family two-component response regulator
VRLPLRQLVEASVTGIWGCEDGADALAACEVHQPDVVLMDVRMPRMDGFTAKNQILRTHPKARAIIVTGFDDDALRRTARQPAPTLPNRI